MRPTSMPSSRLLVAIKPLSSPLFSPVSAAIRDGFARLPWWIDWKVDVPHFEPARQHFADGAGVREQQHGFVFDHVIANYPKSGCHFRVSVEFPCKPHIFLGRFWKNDLQPIILATGTRMISTRRLLPTRNWATLSGLPMVADKPIIWKSLPIRFLIRSSAKDSWLPRLLSASSCTSSIITHCRLCRCWRRSQPESMACKVSGVVIRMSGGLRDWRVRSLVSVSPWRTASLMSRLLHHHSSRSSMSLFNARSGVMYRLLFPVSWRLQKHAENRQKGGFGLARRRWRD